MIQLALQKVGSAITIGRFSFQWYGILIVLGIVTALFIMREGLKRKKIDPDAILEIAVIVIPMGIIGARFHYVLWSWREFAGRPFWHVFAFWEGGLAIFGAVVFGLLGLLIYALWRKIPFLTLFDTLAPGLALAQAIGRWGNFANQEIYGFAVANPALRWFPLSVLIDADGMWHYALFFYESMINLALFFFLFFWVSRKAKRPGTVALWYLLIYGAARAVLEGFRETPYIQNIAGVPVNMIFAIVIAAAAGIMLIVWAAKQRRSAYVKELSDDLVLIHDRKKVIVDADGNVLNYAELTEEAEEPEGEEQLQKETADTSETKEETEFEENTPKS